MAQVDGVVPAECPECGAETYRCGRHDRPTWHCQNDHDLYPTEPPEGLVEAVDYHLFYEVVLSSAAFDGPQVRRIAESTTAAVLAYLNAHPAEAAALLPAVERWTRLNALAEVAEDADDAEVARWYRGRAASAPTPTEEDQP